MNLYEILQNSDRVGEGMTHFERLFAQKVGGGKINKISGVPPLRYIGDGRPLTDYLISGNAVQDGTPSPDAPVDVVGCGVRTGNLFDIKDGTQTISDIVWTAKHGSITAHGTTTAASGSDGVIVYDGTFTRSGNYINYCKIQASKSIKPPAGTYTFSANANPSDSSRIALIVGDNDAYFANQTARKIAVGETFSVNGNEYVMLVVSTNTALNQYDFADIMLNLGSTALPYEPYGFKLPLTVNGVEYPIYLGTVPTMRRVKKLVLTGEETWQHYSAPSGVYGVWQFYADAVVEGLPLSSARSNIADYGVTATTRGSYPYGVYLVTNGTGVAFQMAGAKDKFQNVTAWKAYLAAQYAAGTPVTVWYVLAEPETGIVNEPLMKIGDYADTISAAQAGVTIPTVSGANVLDVLTEVKPSEVWIRGRIKEV